MTLTVDSVRAEIGAGKATCASIVEQALERATDHDGTGSLAFLRMYTEEARSQARFQDSNPRAAKGALTGIPVSIKDIFDVRGEVTTAGSLALKSAPPAMQDAPAIARLKAQGAILVGRTNMTEFAYSGVGINPHYGTPPNLYDLAHVHIPGGSSSGAAVSVQGKMAVVALGSDTGGSVRIPAALCGLTGFKPTKNRIPTEGMFPLSPTLDSVGVIAPSVRCCHAVDAVLRREAVRPLCSLPIGNAVFAVPSNYFLDGMDEAVTQSFERALSTLSRHGARLVTVEVPEVLSMLNVNANGGFAAAESFRFHERLGLDMNLYDPRVRARILRGAAITKEDYAAMVKSREELLLSFAKQNIGDGLLCPTVPVVAPKISALADDDEFHRINLLLLRNPSVANFLDMCAISLPCHSHGDAPVGLMIMGRSGTDARLMSCALGVEEMRQATC